MDDKEVELFFLRQIITDNFIITSAARGLFCLKSSRLSGRGNWVHQDWAEICETVGGGGGVFSFQTGVGFPESRVACTKVWNSLSVVHTLKYIT